MLFMLATTFFLLALYFCLTSWSWI